MARSKNPYECSDCDCKKRSHVLFKDAKDDPDTWIMFDCDTCREPYCKDHASEDEHGVIECNDCYAQRLLKEINIIDTRDQRRHTHTQDLTGTNATTTQSGETRCPTLGSCG